MLNRKRTHTVIQIGPNFKQQARGLTLIACYLMYSKGFSLTQVISAIGETAIKNITPFRDAGIGPDDFPITVSDVLRGLQIGLKHKWV